MFYLRASLYTTLLDVRSGTACPGIELENGCSTLGASQAFRDLTLDPGTYFVQVDGFGGSVGAWSLDIRVLAPQGWAARLDRARALMTCASSRGARRRAGSCRDADLWNTEAVRPLTFDLGAEERRPYFLWEEDISVAELRSVLRGADTIERDRLLGKMLREARDTDVWSFVAPREVAEALPRLTRRLGRRASFWTFLIDGWRRDGLL